MNDNNIYAQIFYTDIQSRLLKDQITDQSNNNTQRKNFVEQNRKFNRV